MVFTRSRPAKQRGAVAFTLFALGDWLPRLGQVTASAPQLRPRDPQYPESARNRGNQS